MINVEHPEHYNVGAIKYFWRWKHKGDVEDLEKTKWYIDKLIERAKQ